MFTWWRRWRRRTARDVMVPVKQVVYLDLTRPLAHNLSIARQRPFAWYPVCEGSQDHTVGAVRREALLRLPTDAGTLGEILDDILFVPDVRPASEVLQNLDQGPWEMAVVIDEYGSVDGIVTRNDLLGRRRT